MEIGLARKVFQILPNQLIDAGPQSFRAAPGLANHFIVHRKRDVHTLLLCAHVIRVKCLLLAVITLKLFQLPFDN